MPNISLPHDFVPRKYQRPVFEALDRGVKRIVVVMHRRAGKDKTIINATARHMFGGPDPKNSPRYGAHYYVLPTYEQGRKIVWQGMDKDGYKFTDHIPEALRVRTDNQSMIIEGMNVHDRGKPGSIFQVVGSDRIDSLVGTNPIFVAYSEYSLQDPNAWNYLRPILAENGGVALFNYTPRGNNHGKRLFQMAEQDPDNWLALKVTVEDSGAIPPDVLERERKEMFDQTGSDALFMQEYYCSFDAPVPGAYYGVQMLEAQAQGRVGRVAHDPGLPVHTFWDLGIDDSMTVWFMQQRGNQLLLIDYEEQSGKGLPQMAPLIYGSQPGTEHRRQYLWGYHVFPHDISVTEVGTGVARIDKARELFGQDKVRVAPKLGLEEGIDAVRTLLSRCAFDATRCERGLDCLNGYTKEFVEKNGVYSPKPKHDWASHGADSFRYLAVSYGQVLAESSSASYAVFTT